MIKICEVKTYWDRRKFATYPLKLYKNCPYYVPSLRSDEMNMLNEKYNFSLKESKAKCFLCYKDNELVGRIAGVINYPHNKLTGKKYVRFSRFECIDDIEVFKALLGAVENFGKQEGMELIHGPWGFNDTDREGMLTFGFDRRSTYATNYYYPYFCENMKKLGYADESKWLERKFVIPEKPIEKICRVTEKICEKHHFVDLVDIMPWKKIVEQYAGKYFETMNDAYADLDGYTPIVGDAQKNVLKQFASIINPRYASMIRDENDNIAGFGIVLPSIADALIKHKGRLFPFGFIDVLKSCKKPKQLEMALIGVKKEYQNSGINAVIMSKIMFNIIEDKIELLESNPMLENNYRIQQNWGIAETEIVRRRQTYVKNID